MLKVVEKHYDEYVEFTKKLVSLKSLPCDEKDCAEYILSELQKLPIDEAFIDGCGNVVGVIRGTGEGPNILLNGHIDVVPEGTTEKWLPFKPYEPEIVDGYFYGRGIADMKAGVAATFWGFKAVADYLAETGKKLSGDLIYSGVVQEEPAEMFGMKYFMEKTMPEHNLSVDFVYVAEPTNGDIKIGQRGKIELVCKTYGKSVHSSAPHFGVNALQHMNPVIQAIFDGDGINLDPDPYLGNTCITITNIGVKPGGNLSTVPDYCEIAIDRRYSTAMSEEDLLGEFHAIFDKVKEKYPDFEGTIEPRYFEETSWTGYTEKVKKWHPAWRIERDNEFVVKTFEALEGIGQSPKEAYAVGGTDCSMSCAIHGIPSVLYCNAAEQTCHREQECIKLSELIDAYEGYVAILAKVYDIDLAEFDK